jgi:hypothetical protein
MPLIFKKEPDEVKDIVKTQLDRMNRKMAFSTPKLADLVAGGRAKPAPTQALPVYHLGLEDLADKADLKSAIQTGWRYMVKQEDEVLASAETVFDDEKNPQFAHINEGPLVEGTIQAIAYAEDKDEIKKGDYEVKILMIPSLYVALLWLVDKKKDADLAIPISPTSDLLEPNKVTTMKKVMEILQKSAKELLDSQPPGASN